VNFPTRDVRERTGRRSNACLLANVECQFSLEHVERFHVIRVPVKRHAVAALTRSAQHYQTALVAASAGGLQLPASTVRDLNARLLRSERELTNDQGLRERPWFKHQIYAPGAYTGYGVKTLPAIREPLEERKYQQAEDGIPVVAKVIADEAALVDSLAAEVDAAQGGRASGK